MGSNYATDVSLNTKKTVENQVALLVGPLWVNLEYEIFLINY